MFWKRRKNLLGGGTRVRFASAFIALVLLAPGVMPEAAAALPRKAPSQPAAVALDTPIHDTTAPSMPAGLAGSGVSASQIDLSWSASTDDVGVQGYKLYRDGVYLAAIGPIGSTSFNDTGLAQGTAYAYRLTAIDAAGNESAQSSAVSVSTQLPPPDATPPTVPGSPAANATRWNLVSLSWTPSSDDTAVTRYAIYRDAVKVSVVGRSTTTFTDLSTVGSTSYQYSVTALDAAGNESSPALVPVVVTPVKPDAPTVTLTIPSTTLFETESIGATATAGPGITRLEILVDGSSIASSTTSPVSMVWDTHAVADGDHAMEARALSSDGQWATSDPVTITIGNTLPPDTRLDVDEASGRLTDDEYALSGVYALGSQQMLPARYRSPTFAGEGTTSITRYLDKWDDLSTETQEAIDDFLQQPLRGAMYALSQQSGGGASPEARDAAQADAPASADDAPEPPPWITDPCSPFRPAFIFPIIGYKCTRETDHFSIVYVVNGEGELAPETVALSNTLGEGRPDYVENVADALEDAWTIYTEEEGHLFFPVNFPNDLVPVQIDATNGGQVLPNAILISPCPLLFCSPWPTIQIQANHNQPFYLAHHELFHVFQLGYVKRLSLIRTGINKDPWWWTEATAEWAAGYVEQMGKPSEPLGYLGWLQTFLSRPSERIDKFDEPGVGRQYGEVLLAEYIAEKMDHGVQHNGLMREIWETIGDKPVDFQRAIPAIDEVAQRYDTSLAQLLPEFWRANYFLDYDNGQLGGEPSNVNEWRQLLDNGATAHDAVGPPRPARDQRHLDPGVAVSGTAALDGGGAAFIELVPNVPAVGAFSITLGGDIQDKVDARILSLTYPPMGPDGNLVTQPTICEEIPIDITGGTGATTIGLPASCEYAVLMLTDTSALPRLTASVNWSATFDVPTTTCAPTDAFSRTLVGETGLGESGWGTSDAGLYWLSDPDYWGEDPPGLAFGVNGDRATISYGPFSSNDNYEVTQKLAFQRSETHTVRAKFAFTGPHYDWDTAEGMYQSVTMFLSDGDHEHGLNSFSAASVSFNPSATSNPTDQNLRRGQMSVREPNGQYVGFATFDIPLGTHNQSSPFWMLVDADATGNRVKVWWDGDPEPVAWSADLSGVTSGRQFSSMVIEHFVNVDEVAPGITGGMTMDDFNITAAPGCMFDDFNRTGSNLGVATSGHSWTYNNGSGISNLTNGSVGTTQITAGSCCVGTAYNRWGPDTTPWSTGNFTMVARVRTSAISQLVGFQILDATDEVVASINLDMPGSAFNAAQNRLATFRNTAPTYVVTQDTVWGAPDRWWQVEWEYRAGAYSRARVWPEGDPIPETWAVNAVQGPMTFIADLSAAPTLSWRTAFNGISVAGAKTVEVDHINFMGAPLP